METKSFNVTNNDDYAHDAAVRCGVVAGALFIAFFLLGGSHEATKLASRYVCAMLVLSFHETPFRFSVFPIPSFGNDFA